VLHDNEILIGKAVDMPDPGEEPKPIASINKIFKGNCPLWTYILAEAMHHKAEVKTPATGGPATIKTPCLGPVGGRIVAEAFLGMMFGDSSSLLRSDPAWVPATGEKYTLKNFVLYATGK
jgi:hypothetical protein